MYYLKFSEDFKKDVAGIHEYISKDGVAIANEQIRKMREKAKKLKDFPKLGKVLEGTKYRFLVSKPYLIFYELFEDKKYVEIVRVIDGRRNYMKLLKF